MQENKLPEPRLEPTKPIIRLDPRDDAYRIIITMTNKKTK